MTGPLRVDQSSQASRTRGLGPNCRARFGQLLDHRAGFPPAIGGDFGRSTGNPSSRARSAPRSSFHQAATRSTPTPASVSSQPSSSGWLAWGTRRSSDPPYAPIGLTRTGLVLPGFDPADLALDHRNDDTDNRTMLSKPHAPTGRGGICGGTAGCCPPWVRCPPSTVPSSMGISY